MSDDEQTTAGAPRPRNEIRERRRRRSWIILALGSVVALLATVGLVTWTYRGDSGADDGVVSTVADTGPARTSSPTTASPTSTPTPAVTPSATVRPSAKPAAKPRAAKPIPPAPSTPKKGVSTYDFSGNAQALVDVKASWYYNWSPAKTNTGGTDPGIEFVPMIWGPANVNATTLSQVKTRGTVLLGFNEPDFASQSNMTVQKALDLWPQLQGTGMRLGSPAVAFGADRPGGWLDQFMAGAATRGYRVDFITLHWYGGDFSPAAVGQLKGYLQATWNRYHKPIWLTEYALMRFANGGATVPTQQEQVAFVQGSTAMLEGLSFVERYAWFSLPAKEANSTGLYRTGTTPTEVGVAYRAAGPG
jgi:hypothetical protein